MIEFAVFRFFHFFTVIYEVHGVFTLASGPCSSMLVSGSSRINDNMMTASSSRTDLNFDPYYGRLGLSSHWQSKEGDPHPWFQVQFWEIETVRVLILQSASFNAGYITEFYLSCSNDTLTWENFTVNGLEEISGLNAATSRIDINFDNSMCCLFMRIYPISYMGVVGLRLDFSGCPCGSYFKESTAVTMTTALASSFTTTNANYSDPSFAIMNTCACQCAEQNQNLTTESKKFQQKIKELITETKVELNSTSKYKRSKSCAQDNRVTSRVIGSAGAAVLVILCVIFLVMDAGRVTASFTQIKNIGSSRTNNVIRSGTLRENVKVKGQS